MKQFIIALVVFFVATANLAIAADTGPVARRFCALWPAGHTPCMDFH
jgi:hypothetical protein